MDAKKSDTSSKRQLLFASLLRFAPTSVPLRDRIINELTLAGLVGSTNEKPFTVGMILSNVFAGSKNSLRVERIQEALKRLIEKDKYVGTIEYNKKHAYYLLPNGAKEAQQSLNNAEDVFEVSLRRVLNGIEHCCPYETAAEVCRNFLLECFSRFGVQMAKTVTGQIQPSDLVRQADVQAAFEAAARKSNIEGAAAESLHAKCTEILKSNHPDDVKMRFLITQGYYFAQLAEYGNSAFNPLLKESYSGSILVIDTNVILLSVQDIHGRRLFSELVTIARQLDIKLAVTRATQLETLGALDGHRDAMRKIMESLPEKLIRMSGDELVDAYIERRALRPDLTVDEFIADAISEVHSHPEMLGISVLNLDEDSMLNGRPFPEAERVIQEEALRSRHWKKPPMTLKHDVAHYAYITDQRIAGSKTWFLTRDRGLPLAAARLAGPSEIPFTFDLTGFLESVSPFVSSTESESGLSDILAALISENLIPKAMIFNVHELRLLVEMHEDILCTPPDQLVQAVDYVKHSILSGETYNAAKYNEVALGLRSFLASSSDEQRRELEAQRARADADREKQARIAAEERERREAQETITQQQLREIEELQEAKDQQDATIKALQKQVDSLAEKSESLVSTEESYLRLRSLVGWGWLGVSFLALFAAHAWGGTVAGYIQWKFQWYSHWNWNLLRLGTRLLASGNFVWCTARTRLSEAYGCVSGKRECRVGCSHCSPCDLPAL